MQSVSEPSLDAATTPAEVPSTGELTVVVASTYTAEPIEGPLLFWLDELGFSGRVEFAPYNQVLQQLLDPTSEIGRNARGINLVLVRLEDWARFKPDRWDDAAIRSGAEELGRALRAFAERSGTPTIIVSPPPRRRLPTTRPAPPSWPSWRRSSRPTSCRSTRSTGWVARTWLGIR